MNEPPVTIEMLKTRLINQYLEQSTALKNTIDLLSRIGVTDLSNIDSSPEASDNNAMAQTGDHHQKPSVRKLINAVVQTYAPEGIFTRDAVFNDIREHYRKDVNPSTFGVIFNIAAKVEGWEVVERGVGGKPSVYRVPATKVKEDWE